MRKTIECRVVKLFILKLQNSQENITNFLPMNKIIPKPKIM